MNKELDNMFSVHKMFVEDGNVFLDGGNNTTQFWIDPKIMNISMLKINFFRFWNKKCIMMYISIIYETK